MIDGIVYQKIVTKLEVLKDLEHILRHELKNFPNLTDEQDKQIYNLVVNDKQLQENSIIMFIEAELASKCPKYAQNSLENELLIQPIREIINKVKGN